MILLDVLFIFVYICPPIIDPIKRPIWPPPSTHSKCCPQHMCEYSYKESLIPTATDENSCASTIFTMTQNLVYVAKNVLQVKKNDLSHIIWKMRPTPWNNCKKYSPLAVAGVWCNVVTAPVILRISWQVTSYCCYKLLLAANLQFMRMENKKDRSCWVCGVMWMCSQIHWIMNYLTIITIWTDLVSALPVVVPCHCLEFGGQTLNSGPALCPGPWMTVDNKLELWLRSRRLNQTTALNRR